MLPTVASALGISIVSANESGGNDGILQVGETITLDLRLENNDYEIVKALDVIVFGQDEEPGLSPNISSGLTLVGGAVAPSIFNQVPGLDFSGMSNIISAPRTLFSVNNVNPEVVRVQLFGGILLAGTTGDGAGDNGVNGSGLTGAGGIHFQVTFQNIPNRVDVSNINLRFGTSEALGAVAVGDTSIIPFSNAAMNLTVIPEPGTALLMGLGLAGLASSRRR
jgi:hypothetical protein